MPAFLKQKKNLLIIVSVAVVALLAVTAFFVFNKDTSETQPEGAYTQTPTTSEASSDTTKTSSDVNWQWSGNEWASNGTPPDCPSPLLSDLPVDINKVTAILYPGQTRGGNYKPHGGFRFGSDNSIAVTAPLEAKLVEGSRYIESGEVQYLFTFINSCGIAYRFDHLNTLSEKFQTYANQLPEAKVDDSRTTPFNPPLKVSKGVSVATKVGFVNTANVSMDFGVYDLRAPNQASKNPTFAEAHEAFKGYTFYGICWLDEYPSAVSTQLKALPAGDSANGKTSDYCK